MTTSRSAGAPIDLAATPIHLGLGATAEVLPPFDGTTEWYGRYSADTSADGPEGRLVSWHTFDAPWDSWEMHPHGHELVVCVNGTATLVQELPDGATHTVTLSPGEAAVNPPGVWHTMDVVGSAAALFVTAGSGTEHRPR